MDLHPARVTSVNPPYVQVYLLETGRALNNILRPTPSGQRSGYHWMPAVGDRVLVTYWSDGVPYILAGFSVAGDATAALLPSLQATEHALYGPTGNLIRFITNGTVQVGDPTQPFKNIVLDGQQISVSGNVPSGGGGVTLNGTISAPTTITKAN